MKTTLALLLLAILAACCPSEAAEPSLVAAYEAQAIQAARQSPEVIKLRLSLNGASEAERGVILSKLANIYASAAAYGRAQGLQAAIEARQAKDAELHRQWEAERRHEELILTLQNLNLGR